MLKGRQFVSLNELFASIVAALTFFYIGFSTGFSTVFIYELNSNENTINADEESWIGSSGIIFSFFGCFIQGYLANKFGRKVLFYLIYGVHFVGWMIVSQTKYIIEARLLISIVIGVSFSNSIYITEIIRSERRGNLALLHSLFLGLGALFLYISSYYITVEVVSFGASIFALIIFINVIFIPETPYWYLLKKQRENAIKSLIWLRGAQPHKIEIEVKEMEKNVDDGKTHTSTELPQILLDLKWWKYFFKFSVYVVLIEFSGYDVLFMYTMQIIAKINKTGINNKCVVILFSVTVFVGSLITTIFVEKFRRKKMIMFYNLVNILLPFTIGSCVLYFYSFYSSIISLIALFIYGATSSIISITLSWIIISENLPTTLRATIYAVLCAESYVFYFLIVKFAPIIMKSISISYTMYIFAFISLLNVIWVHFYADETQGIILPGN